MQGQQTCGKLAYPGARDCHAVGQSFETLHRPWGRNVDNISSREFRRNLPYTRNDALDESCKLCCSAAGIPCNGSNHSQKCCTRCCPSGGMLPSDGSGHASA